MQSLLCLTRLLLSFPHPRYKHVGMVCRVSCASPVSSSLLGALCIAAGSLASAQVCKHASTPFLPCPSPRLLLSPRCSLHRCRLACLRAGMQACVYSLLALSISPSPPLSSVLSASLPARLPPRRYASMRLLPSCLVHLPVSSSLLGALCIAAGSLASVQVWLNSSAVRQLAWYAESPVLRPSLLLSPVLSAQLLSPSPPRM
ncbi:unnamed protein product [Closterium sp. NIES-65]|nr:unnamed protein product [Closterium sp. NIES-65]